MPPNTRLMVATTNEDDLLERAGVAPVLHLHGSLFETSCARSCGWHVSDDEDNAWSLRPCPRCGARTRPGSVWFGEPVPEGALQALADFDPDGCLVVGSSSIVQPIAAIPPELALADKPVVDINIEETPLAGVPGVQHLRGTAALLLPELVDLMTSALVRSRSTQGIP
jgi:NAD-dependent deacetylase